MKESGKNEFTFYCPGCKTTHWFRTKAGKDEAVWEKKGTGDKLEVSPDVIVYPNRPESFCRVSITGGQLKYHKKCHHHLAGQTVPMPNMKIVENQVVQNFARVHGKTAMDVVNMYENEKNMVLVLEDGSKHEAHAKYTKGLRNHL